MRQRRRRRQRRRTGRPPTPHPPPPRRRGARGARTPASRLLTEPEVTLNVSILLPTAAFFFSRKRRVRSSYLSRAKHNNKPRTAPPRTQNQKVRGAMFFWRRTAGAPRVRPTSRRLSVQLDAKRARGDFGRALAVDTPAPARGLRKSTWFGGRDQPSAARPRPAEFAATTLPSVQPGVEARAAAGSRDLGCCVVGKAAHLVALPSSFERQTLRASPLPLPASPLT